MYVIIPHYNRWDLTHARLWELYKQGKDFITEVLVIDDCSTDEQTTGGLTWWEDFYKKTDFKVVGLKTPENLNFLKACNFGLSKIIERANPEDVIILLSNDVLVRGNIFSDLKEILSQPKKMVGGILLSHDTGWNKFGEKIYPYLEGWLLATTVESWLDLGGGFDEQYSPSDYEDVDISTLALKRGYELIPLNNVNLQHLGAQTIGYNPAREKITKENRQKFFEKWVKDA